MSQIAMSETSSYVEGPWLEEENPGDGGGGAVPFHGVRKLIASRPSGAAVVAAKQQRASQIEELRWK
jgi:hypothetical protein